jgi:single-strand DNA-binding protein
MDWAADMTEQLSSAGVDAGHVNTVTLVGRVSAAPDARDLPSGDRLVTLRVVVDRPPGRGSTKRAVDVIDVACWSKRTQRTATSLTPDDTVRVEGALRRRFFATGAGRASRYEVEAARLVRVSLAKAS